MINEVRNIFAHQGDYWSFNLNQVDSESSMLQDLFLEEERSKGKSERIYEIRLSFVEFRRICVRGCINFIDSYLYKGF